MDEQEEFEFRARAEAEHAHATKAETPAAEPPPEQPGAFVQGLKQYGAAVAGPLEAGESLLTGAVATPVAGLAGIAQGAYNSLPEGAQILGQGPSAAERVGQVQEAGTYQPRTQLGQATVQSASAPLQAVAAGANKAGQFSTDVATKVGASPEVAAGIGATVNTGLQMLPGLASPELVGRAGRGAPKPGILNTPAASAAQRAETYVRNRAGVDWNSLSQGFRDTLTKIASSAESLDKLSPEDVARKARLDAAGIKGTRGQVTRNLAQITREENLTKSESGEGIRATKAAQDSRLHALVDEVKANTGAKAETRSQVGKSVQDEGLRAKARASKKNYDDLYQKARETEPEAKVDSQPLHEYFKDNPSVQHTRFLQDWLSRAKIEEGSGVKLAELDDLRKKAGRVSKTSEDYYHAQSVVRTIDQMFNDVPAAAKNWRAARDAFTQHKTEFEDTGINKKLGSDKSRVDRRVALEDTTDKIIGSSAEDIVQLRKSLGDGSTHWKEVQGGVITKLKEAATGKREIGNEQGVKQFNASFRDLFNELDKDGKIDAIFSPEQAKRLRDINQLVEDVRTTPSGRISGSDTVPRLIALLDKVDKVPLLGHVAKATAGGLSKLYQAGEEGRQGRAAVRDPFEDAAHETQGNLHRKRANRAAAAVAPVAAATIGQLQRDQ